MANIFESFVMDEKRAPLIRGFRGLGRPYNGTKRDALGRALETCAVVRF